MTNTIAKLRESLRELGRNTLLRRLFGVAVMVCTLGVLIGLLVRGRDELHQIESWRDCWSALGESFLLYPVSLVIQALVWSMMIARLAQIARGWRDIEIYVYTHLMRHLPGGIWYLAGRTMVYGELGVRSTATLAASGLEWLLLLSAAALVWSFTRLLTATPWWLGVVIPLGTLAACVGIGRWARAHLGKIRPKLPEFLRRWLEAWSSTSTVPGAAELVLWTGAYTAAYAIGGVIVFLLVNGIAPGATITILDAVSIWALTGGVASLTSTFLPVGLVVRELTLTALLTPALDTTHAVLVALLLRALFTSGDLVWGGAMWGMARAFGHRRR